MGFEDDERTCASASRWMSLSQAREALRTHGAECALGTVASGMVAGGHRACWPEAANWRAPPSGSVPTRNGIWRARPVRTAWWR